MLKKSNKLIKMQLLEMFDDNPVLEPEMAVVVDYASAKRVRGGKAFKVHNIAEIHLVQHIGDGSSFQYDNGCSGWGIVYMPNDDRAREV